MVPITWEISMKWMSWEKYVVSVTALGSVNTQQQKRNVCVLANQKTLRQLSSSDLGLGLSVCLNYNRWGTLWKLFIIAKNNSWCFLFPPEFKLRDFILLFRYFVTLCDKFPSFLSSLSSKLPCNRIQSIRKYLMFWPNKVSQWVGLPSRMSQKNNSAFLLF